MRRWLLLTLFAISGCSRDEPERGVDTTLPAEPATISGSLTAPDEYMPADMKVCAETLDGRTASCAAEISSAIYTATYSLSLPAGSYRVYARTEEVPNYKAYYSECAAQTPCSSLKPVIVKVDEGETRSGVDPKDWSKRPVPAPVSNESNYDPSAEYGAESEYFANTANESEDNDSTDSE